MPSRLRSSPSLSRSGPGSPARAWQASSSRRCAVPEPGALLLESAIVNGVTQAMADGYERRAVLVGLGYWVADGHMFASQITEFIQKARLHGGPVPDRGEADDLLSEGRDRFTRRETQKAGVGLSKAEARRAASQAAINEFVSSRQ